MQKIDLPKFDGTLEKWNHFWIQYEESIHNNESLTKTQKLSYLRQCVVSQTVKDLLLPGSKDPGVYDGLVKMLHRRYDKPRKLHELYCERLVNLPMCKGTAEDLLAAGDRLHKLVDGLVTLGQTDIQSIATSLDVATLPIPLQTEWNTLTKGQKGVPSIEEFITFLREKSDSMCSLTRKGEGGHSSRVQKGGGAQSASTYRPKASVHVTEVTPRSMQHCLHKLAMCKPQTRQEVKGSLSS